MSRLTAMRGPVKSGGLEETMGVPRAVARSEALRMMRVMSMGGVSVHPACMGEVCQCMPAWGRGSAGKGVHGNHFVCYWEETM